MTSFLPGYAQGKYSGREQLIQKPTGCAHNLVVDLDLTVSEHHSGGVKYTEDIPMDEPNKVFFAGMVAWLISKGVNVCIITRGISTLVIPWLEEVFGRYAQGLIISSGKKNEGKVFEKGQVSVFAPTKKEFKQHPRLYNYVNGFLSDKDPYNIFWADKKVAYMNDYLHQVFEKEKELYNEEITMSGSEVTFEDIEKGRFVFFTDDTQANVDAMSAYGIKSIKAVPGRYVNNMLTIIGELPKDIIGILPVEIIPTEKIIGITEEIIVSFPELRELKDSALIKSVYGEQPYKKQKTNGGGKSKSKRKTKSKRKSKRRTIKK